MHINVSTFSLGCKESSLGTEYIGTLSSTKDGHTCIAWTDQPEQVFYDKDWMFPDGSVRAASNYCRNPGRDVGGPWCFTGDEETHWDYCHVLNCADVPTVLGADVPTVLGTLLELDF